MSEVSVKRARRLKFMAPSLDVLQGLITSSSNATLAAFNFSFDEDQPGHLRETFLPLYSHILKLLQHANAVEFDVYEEHLFGAMVELKPSSGCISVHVIVVHNNVRQPFVIDIFVMGGTFVSQALARNQDAKSWLYL